MKVTATTATSRELSSTLDLFGSRKLTEDQKTRIQQDVGDFLLEQTLFFVGNEESPIDGESWQSLSPAYKKKKEDEIGSGVADLQLTGQLLDELSYLNTSSGIKIGIFGDRAPVGDGHCNFTGKSKLPRRRFIPFDGQNYKSSIEREVEAIIQDIIAETEDPSIKNLREVSDSKDLFRELKNYFKDQTLTKAELRTAVFRNPILLDVLMEEDLLEFL